MNLPIKLHFSDSTMPTRATDGSGALDLYAQDCWHEENFHVCCLGISVEIPEGYVGILSARSSCSERQITLSNNLGIIDSDFRGLLEARFVSTGNFPRYYEVGDRCAQLLIVPVLKVKPVRADSLPSTARGDGGFGSTGVK